MRRIILKRTLEGLIVMLICAAIPSSIMAQGTTQYVYDDNGRLHAVISPSGEAAVYEYDAAGNFTAIRRLKADDLELFSFSPHEGVPGDLVTFTGVGFGAGVSAVLFNGTQSRIVNTTLSTVVAEVPQGATTGAVTITTPRWSVVTPIPFTIRGIRLSPSVVSRLLPGDNVQFTASVTLDGDQSLKWSVNEAESGNAAVGAISTDGLYTAPNLPLSVRTSTFFVRATSVAVPEVFGEAQVTVVNPEFVRVTRSSAVSVRIGNTTAIAPTSGGVSVRIGNTTTASLSSMGVSVRVGNTSTVSPNSAGVSVTTSPNISSISPNQISRGATITFTISGANLSGAADIKLIDANGAIDSNIVASNPTVSADGTLLTATLNVSASAAPGQRVVIVITANGHSQTVNTSTNTMVIQ